MDLKTIIDAVRMKIQSTILNKHMHRILQQCIDKKPKWTIIYIPLNMSYNHIAMCNVIMRHIKNRNRSVKCLSVRNRLQQHTSYVYTRLKGNTKRPYGTSRITLAGLEIVSLEDLHSRLRIFWLIEKELLASKSISEWSKDVNAKT